MNLALQPFEFWLAVLVLLVGLVLSSTQVKRGVGIPMAAVLATISIWYVGDVLYNDYERIHLRLFAPSILAEAWIQVIIFLTVFIVTAPTLNIVVNGKILRRTSSQVLKLTPAIVGGKSFQDGLDVLLRAALIGWVAIIGLAVFRYQSRLISYFIPLIGGHPGPWVASGLGGGFDSVLALANYIQLMLGSLFGVVLALSNRRNTRLLALLGVALTWPFYIFDRTRKFILIIAAPAVAAWSLLRVRGSLFKKFAIIVSMTLFVNAWFGFIISNRLDSSIASAFSGQGFDFANASQAEHQGLNMYEELCWIIMLKQEGTFNPNVGENYFANLVNPVPRSLWPEKPTIGIDYAIARGLGGADTAVGVYATLSNGLVGQGVVNFGLYFGPAFAGVMLALWACWLSRIDLRLERIGYLPLYGLGLIVTFTMGRDVTLLEAYPFVFGFLVVGFLRRRQRGRLSLPVKSNKFDRS